MVRKSWIPTRWKIPSTSSNTFREKNKLLKSVEARRYMNTRLTNRLLHNSDVKTLILFLVAPKQNFFSVLTTWKCLACRYNEHNLKSFMAFISRLINKRIFDLITKFNVSTNVVEQIENDYPLDGMWDHHRFLLWEVTTGCRIESELDSFAGFISDGITGL